jgi:hypothetical protein
MFPSFFNLDLIPEIQGGEKGARFATLPDTHITHTHTHTLTVLTYVLQIRNDEIHLTHR